MLLPSSFMVFFRGVSSCSTISRSLGSFLAFIAFWESSWALYPLEGRRSRLERNKPPVHRLRGKLPLKVKSRVSRNRGSLAWLNCLPRFRAHSIMLRWMNIPINVLLNHIMSSWPWPTKMRTKSSNRSRIMMKIGKKSTISRCFVNIKAFEYS